MFSASSARLGPESSPFTSRMLVRLASRGGKLPIGCRCIPGDSVVPCQACEIGSGPSKLMSCNAQVEAAADAAAAAFRPSKRGIPDPEAGNRNNVGPVSTCGCRIAADGQITGLSPASCTYLSPQEDLQLHMPALNSSARWWPVWLNNCDQPVHGLPFNILLAAVPILPAAHGTCPAAQP